MSPAEDSRELASLLEHLKSARGFDFSGYKRSSLERRIRKRIEELGIDGYAEYLDHLQVNPDEFTDLFDTILINVTGFFRDPPAWEYLSEEVVPQVLEAVPSPAPIRVWSAACASGEEAYTVAMVLAEALGEEEFRARVKIYATDVDEQALAQARQAVYPRKALEAVPPHLVEKYFERNASGYQFRSDLRKTVIFGRNNLVQDAPISRIDLLVSRNALMYFTPQTQATILQHFNFALKDTGFLFLGKSEMLITHDHLFRPENLKRRVFRKVPSAGLSERLMSFGDAAGVALAQTSARPELRDAALELSDVAQIVLDDNGFVVSVNQRARALFGAGASDVGRPLQDLELSYRPADLRTALARARDEQTTVRIGRVSWTSPRGEDTTLEITVAPLLDGESILGATLTFQDVTDFVRLDEQARRSKRELETAHEELQSTVEELETTNEELHSTNEELETTNEELQSTNEELETMNEELQSTNDELETMNDDQQVRTHELDRANLFLEGILGTLGVGVMVLDEDRRVQVWNGSSEDLWGLRAEEVDGKKIDELDIGLPVKEVQQPITDVMADGEGRAVTLSALSRRGRTFDTQVRVLALRSPTGTTVGTILLATGPDAEL